MHGDEPGTDLDTVNGEPVRQQGQQGFGDQEQCRLRGIWFPLYEHPGSFSHQAPPSLRMDQYSPDTYTVLVLVTRTGPSVDFCGYWQRSRPAA